VIQLNLFMQNEFVGAFVLLILALVSAVSVSWYSPSNYLPASVFAIFPVMGALGVIFLAHKKNVV
jgi:hypothetical protein